MATHNDDRSSLATSELDDLLDAINQELVINTPSSYRTSSNALPTIKKNSAENSSATQSDEGIRTSFTKAEFTGRKRAEKDKMDQIIGENYRNELDWDQNQAILWLENVLEERFPETLNLSQVLADGTVLCRLLKIVVPESQHSTVIPRYHVGLKLSQMQRIENINFFLDGCQRFGLKGTLFKAVDILQDQNMRAVVSCLEQLMKMNRVTWQKASRKVTIKMSTENGRQLDMAVNENTKVMDIKRRMAEIENVPDTELPQYGLFLAPRGRPRNRPLMPTANSMPNMRKELSKGAFSTSSPSLSMPADEEDEEEASSGTPTKKNPVRSPANRGRRYSVFTTGEIEKEEEDEPLWIEEGASVIGDFVTNPENTDVSFRRMRKQVAKLIQTTTKVDNMQLIYNSATDEKRKPGEPPKILPGDEIKLSFNNIAHLHTNKAILGDLYITKFQLIFIVLFPEESSLCAKRGFRIPLSSIHSITKCQGITAKFGKFYSLELKCKDFHDLKFSYINMDQFKGNLGGVLESTLFPEQPDELFAFANNSENAACGKIEGWDIYNMQKEFKRFGVPNAKWRITELNKNYAYSASYPSLLAVPSSFSDDMLVEVFKFRSKGRIPALCWLHSNGAPLLRCSQPAVGVTGKRCSEDEALFEAIRTTVTSSSEKVHIIDARPHLNAMANQLKGLGYEKSYANMTISFVGIENIHKMRDSAKKLRKVCLNEESAKDTKTEIAKWLAHIKLILTGADQIIQLLQKGSPVLVHCSDGWDRTSQLTSIAELVLDPYYRTIEGFEVLIEKEWLSFGHKFDQRIGHLDKNVKEQAPIFLQFIDAVWQLHHQYPKAFEFNTYFLRVINMHLISCVFGTFLCNCESERMKHNLKKKTLSLWSHTNFHMKDFKNADYTPVNGPLCSTLSNFSLELWTEYYLYWKQYHEDK